MFTMLLGQKQLRWRIFTACIIGLCIALTYWGHIAALHIPRALDRWVLLLYLTILVSAVIFIVLPRLLRLFDRFKYRRAIILCACGALIIGIFVGQALTPNTLTLNHLLTIKTTGQKNSHSQGSEVWVGKIEHADGTQVPITEFVLDGPWEVINGVPTIRKSVPAKLTWTSALTENVQLHFVAHPWSGIARVDWDGTTQDVDLYAEQSTEKVLDLPVRIMYVPGKFVRAIIQLADTVTFTLFCFLAGMYALYIVKSPSTNQRARAVYAQLRTTRLRHNWRWNLLCLGISLVVAICCWISLKILIVPDDRLDIRMSAEASAPVSGNIWWNDQQRPFRDGWMVNLTALQFSEARDVRIEIQALPQNEANPATKGNEVWIYDISTDVVPDMDWSHTIYDEHWQKEAADTATGYLIKTNGDSESKFVYQTKAKNWINIPFLHHPWSGKARITVNGQSNVVDLYQDANTVATHSPEFIAILPYTLDNPGILSLPLPQNAKQFQLNFRDTVHRLRIYGIQRVGRSEWLWKPGMPISAGPGNTLLSNPDYTEIQSLPNVSLQLSFAQLSPTAYFWPGKLGTLILILITSVCFGFIRLLPRLFRRTHILAQNISTILTTPTIMSASLGKPALVIMIVAIIIRIKYGLSDPILLSSDSSNYIESAFWFKHLFQTPLLADAFDLRGPGYPAVLAIVFTLMNVSYTSVIIAQAVFGLLSIYGGMRFGQLLGSRWGAIAIGTFLAIAPDVLWYEHVIMTEVLSLTAAIWCCVTGLSYVREPGNLRRGMLFGLCSTLLIYTRPPFITVVAFWLLVALCVVGIPLVQRRWTQWRLCVYWLVTVLSIVFLLVPWIARNGHAYGMYTLLPGTNRGQFIVWMERNAADLALPRLAQLRATYEQKSFWLWVYTLGSNRIEGEAIAGKLRTEQLLAHPSIYAVHALRSTVSFLGNVPDTLLVNQWRNDVTFEQRTYTQGQDSFSFGGESLVFTPYGGYGQTLQELDWLWRSIFSPIRIMLSLFAICCIGIVAIQLTRLLTREKLTISSDPRIYLHMITVCLGCVWLVTVLGLGLNMAVGVRYILPLDWIRVFVIAVGLEAFWNQSIQANTIAAPHAIEIQPYTGIEQQHPAFSAIEVSSKKHISPATRLWRVSGLILLLVVAGWIYWVPSSIGGITTRSGFYGVLAQAFLRGHTYAQVEVPAKVVDDFENKRYNEVFSNPDFQKILWDTGIYKGKTYLYWGPVPGFGCVAWGSFYDLDTTPCYDQGMALFAGVGVVLCLYLIFECLGNLYGLSFYRNALWFVLMVFAFGGIQMYTMGTVYGGIYNTPIVFAIMFILAGMFCFLKYLKDKRLLTLTVMNICFALALGSRLITAIYVFCFALSVVVAERKSLFNKNYSRVLKVCASFIPLVLATVLLLLYNKVRFDSYFEFGMKYTFTTPSARSYIDDNVIYSLAYIPRNIYYYFIETPIFTINQPFMKLSVTEDTFRYWTTSIFVIDPLLFLTLGTIFLWKYLIPKDLYIFFIPLAAGIVGDICNYMFWFGSALRYAYEFVPLLYIFVYIIIMYLYNLTYRFAQARTGLYIALAAMSVWTLFSGFFMLLSFLWKNV